MKRGILVDPNTKAITEVEFGSLQDMYRLLDCDMVEVVSLENADVWVDEEGLLKNDGKKFFGIADYPQWIKGRGLLTGLVDDEGETTGCKLSLDEVKDMVVF